MPLSSFDQVLVYEVGAQQAGGQGLRWMSWDQLNFYLYHNTHLQGVSKQVPRGAHSVDIYVKDTYTPAQKDRYYMMPNYETNLATVNLGWSYTLFHTCIIIISGNKD